ncbi:exosortase Y-associated Wzy-like protein [Mucilaginibacter sp. E4BP6]|uniref:exosortase Y-associated Wzy-like protein n=1 Tax=Mucilaginibacter sp. E4BP6 TaxID=2723089 RepID=UPI0015C8AD41
MRTNSIEKYAILFIPWALSLIFRSNPILSFLTAWAGSFFIFYITLTGKIQPLPTDRPLSEQLMRPLFLVQIIFAGYTCCTSIFYFLSVIGYQNFQAPSPFYLSDIALLKLTAQCQRYYCLGHAAFATGILMFMRYPIKQKYDYDKNKLPNLLLVFALISFPASEIFLRVPGLSQFYTQLNTLSFISGTLALAFAIPLKNVRNTMICLALFFFNFYQALTSGFKEPIIISVLVLGIFLYPNYKKLVAATFIPMLILLFLLLPTFNSVFRQNAWSGDNTDDATQLALDAALNSNGSLGNTNWEFLTSRLSEVDMFTKFVQSTPDNVPYYKTKLLQQSAEAIVPRLFWPSKPSTEDLIMERVYDAGVVYRGEEVSAKPAFIVDAYLSYGGWGVLMAMFAYGALAQIIDNKAEELFGGYILGTALIFSGLFQIFWRGLSFEFIINVVFWSYITMLIVFKILRAKNILNEI